MNIQSAVKEATIVLKNNYIKTAELDTEILLAEVLGSSREYIILNNHKNLDKIKLTILKS